MTKSISGPRVDAGVFRNRRFLSEARDDDVHERWMMGQESGQLIGSKGCHEHVKEARLFS